MVNGALTAGRPGGGFLAEMPERMQGVNMSGRMTILAAAIWLGGCAAAPAACGSALAEFEMIINSDVKTGNLNKGVHRRIVTELSRAQAACIASRDADAIRQLGAIKHRFGYR